MPHQLVPNQLSSKTNFIFNQTPYMPFREIYAVMIPSNLFKDPFEKVIHYNKGEILSCESVKPGKNLKTLGRIMSEQEINLV